jgi:hypothetical protein
MHTHSSTLVSRASVLCGDMLLRYARGMDVAALVVAIFAALAAIGSLVVAVISLRRSPNVLWVPEVDRIAPNDVEPDDPTPYVWTLDLVNRGRESATAVRTRFIGLDGTVHRWNDRGTVAQGGELRLHAGTPAGIISRLADPFVRRPPVGTRSGPAYDIEWRGAKERRKPYKKTFRPSERTEIRD